MSDPIPAPPAEGTTGENVLLLTPTTRERADVACAEQLRGPEGGAGSIVLVTLTESPDDRVRFLRDHGAGAGDHVSVVCANESWRGGFGQPRAVDVRTVRNPGDLARLGVGISDALAEADDHPPTALCFHSVTALLQFVDLDRVFRFLYTLGGRVAGSGARAHYHLDPDAHDDQTVATLSPLFDSVVRVTDDGVDAVA